MRLMMKKKMKQGFTLVELMIVVAIVGILAALAIYGVRRYVLNAKTTEAREGLGRLSKDAANAFQREGMSATLLALGTSTGVSNILCKGAANTVPASKDAIQGKKYQSSPTEWMTGDQYTGWTCVKFSMGDPQYFMYGYTATVAGVAGDIFTATASGDLDGNGTLSTFALTGDVVTSAQGLIVKLAPNFSETMPDE